MSAATITPEEHRRRPEQTYLTYPEWFLVHSPAELARYLEDHRPSTVPYLGHIRQFWQSYAAVYRATKDNYPLNVGYHVMLMVIGASTTVEYGLKAAYETVVGRLTEVTLGRGSTEEDRLAARIAQDYVDFINVTPWYEYDFAGAVGSLWRETSLVGPDLIRKWERKYFLTTEYGVKAIYGWIIKRLTQLGYAPPVPLTAVVVDHFPDGVLDRLPELTVLERLSDGAALLTVPRYDAFKDHALQLAREGARFVEVAGNRSVILVSVLVPADWSEDASRYDIMLAQPILSEPDTQRLVLRVPVAALHRVLQAFDDPRFRLEHVYDY